MILKLSVLWYKELPGTERVKLFKVAAARMDVKQHPVDFYYINTSHILL